MSEGIDSITRAMSAINPQSVVSLTSTDFDVDELRGRDLNDQEILILFAIYDLCYGRVGPKVCMWRVEERYYEIRDMDKPFEYITTRKAQLDAQRWN